jgi:hypothetical protein
LIPSGTFLPAINATAGNVEDDALKFIPGIFQPLPSSEAFNCCVQHYLEGRGNIIINAFRNKSAEA